LQKMACLGITGAMRTALRAVYKVSYPWTPNQCLTVGDWSQSRYLADSAGTINGSPNLNVLDKSQGMKTKVTLQMRTARMIPRHCYDKPFGQIH
jgi:hypothetical protein